MPTDSVFRYSRTAKASQPDGSDWSDSDWLMAVTGELGEFANLRKKVLRGDLPMDLGEAVRSKFNRVSERVDCNVRL